MRLIRIIIFSLTLLGCDHINNNQVDTKNHPPKPLKSIKNNENESRNNKSVQKITYDSVSRLICYHNNLSEQYNIKIQFSRFSSTEYNHDSCSVLLVIKDKNNKTIFDSIKLYSHYFYKAHFVDCNSVRSFTTKINLGKKIIDNNYGDIVVIDLNFDDKDDIVVVNNIGGNGGTNYNFYIQNNGNRFDKDNFLTDSVSYFPSKIDPVKQTLTTYLHAGVCGLGEHIYKYNSTYKNWKETSHRIINICN